MLYLTFFVLILVHVAQLLIYWLQLTAPKYGGVYQFEDNPNQVRTHRYDGMAEFYLRYQNRQERVNWKEEGF